MARALPDEDLASLLGIDAVLHGLLLTDGLPSDVSQRLIRRLVEHGPLPPGATESDLSLLLHDLAMRVHWAMGDGEEYPAASPHRMTYLLDLPGESAAAACKKELTAMGALSVSTTGPGDRRRTATSNENIAAGLVWSVAAEFPEVAPGVAFDARVRALTALAERYGGQYAGAGLY